MKRAIESKLIILLVSVIITTLGMVSHVSADPVKSYTVAEVYANKAALKGQVIKVTGKVVKVNKRIMKRTWVHLEDSTGSGDTAKIVFRSIDGMAEVGDTITAQGTIDLDKDFGMGYFYPVIAEDATFTKK